MKRILGVDLGQVRTGIAISDELRMLAHPLSTIEGRPGTALAQRIRDIVVERDADRIVMGLPRHMNGSLGKAAEEVNQFADKLRAISECPVVMWDERLSTVAANRMLQAAGKKTKQTRAFRDQVAAQIILQSYLDSLT